MKYCKKCGNELKDGYVFCDKCGAKVEEEAIGAEEKVVKKGKEKKEVKKKEEVKDIPVVTKPIIVKKGRGKIIFLSIMNLLLLGSTITFLILWLNKPTVKEEKEKPVEKTNKALGKWEQNIEYKTGNKVVQSIYESIEFKDNYTFEFIYYDKDKKASTREEQLGIYSINNNSIKVEWTEDGKRDSKTFTIKDNKLCLDKECANYVVKNGYNSKLVIPVDEEIETITYTEYKKILSDGKDAIVVVVKDGCPWCEQYESVLDDVKDDYVTPVYYYQNDYNIDVSGTPTTIVIKDGQIVEVVEGYKSLVVIEDILDELGIE